MKLLIILTLLAVFAYSQNPTYRVTNLQQSEKGQTADLDLASGTGPFGNDIKNIRLNVFYENDNRVRIKLTDRNSKRWEVPEHFLEPHSESKQTQARDYTVQIMDPFAILVTRKSDGEILFDTRGEKFVYSNQYLTLTTKVPSENPNIYGLGERVTNFRLSTENKFYTMWTLDRYAQGAQHLYSIHPFYIEKRKNKAHGVLLYNSNAQSVQLRSKAIQFRTIGGILDFYIFSGPTPNEVTKQYHDLIGRPMMPPLWGLGFHQCRYGYKDIDVTRNVWEQYRKHGIPLDVMWNDIDYMDAYKLYTWHPQHYPIPKVQSFVQELHDNDQKYVVIVDPGVKVEKGYYVYEEGLKQKVYITHADKVTPIVNKVWPGYTVFPDFSMNKTVTYWIDLIERFLKEVPVDGWWIDMNEVACFCDGACGPDQHLWNTSKTNNLNYPPYVPMNHKMYYKGLYMDAVTSVGQEYNTHNLYGHFETIATHKALTQITKKRPFIITRSSFPGSGKMAGKWTGDNHSTWSDLFYSISGLLTFNILGIPFSGADICGFEKDATEELCVRWHQLGAWYPFSRNHNGLGARDQEPFAFGPLLIEETRKALLNRYSLLPYYYTLFYHTNQKGGNVMQSLAFEFNEDTHDTINFIDRQFLLGPALLVSPVLDLGATTVHVYIPPTNNTWYDYWNGHMIHTKGWATFQAPINKITVHIRGGHIVPRQDPGLTTAKTKLNPYFLNIALHEGKAHGDLFVDDGVSIDTVGKGEYTFITYDVNNGIIMATVRVNKYDVSPLKMKTIMVYGAHNTCSVNVNGQNHSQFKYDQSTKVLEIKELDLSMGNAFKIIFKC